MKRCPECRKDYVDDGLLYCLDDGTPLVQGVVDEPQTAILHDTAGQSQVQTRAQIYSTDQTAVFPSGSTELSKPKILDKRLLLAPLALAIIILGGFFGYRYFNSARANETGRIGAAVFDNEREPCWGVYVRRAK